MWKRTFTPREAGVYQVVLPFHPGEWEAPAAPLPSWTVPYSWHPDGSVRRVACVLDGVAGALHEVTPASAGLVVEDRTQLPPPRVLRVDQGHPVYTFEVGDVVNAWETVDTGGLLSHRRYVGRPKNLAGSRCDFAAALHAAYWRGMPVREEYRLVGCQPEHATERNWPLRGGVFLDGEEVMLEFQRQKVGDLMCAWHRVDRMRYAVCDQWEGHAVGSHGVDYTKARGGSVLALYGDLEWMRRHPWWYSEWEHGIYGGHTGMHGGFGVCRVDIAAAVQQRDEDAWPLVHELCGEYFSSPYHVVDGGGRVAAHRFERPGDKGGFWALALGDYDYRSGWPRFGKVEDAEQPDRRGRSAEFNSHMRSHGLICALEFAPTPMLLDELVFRAQSCLKIGGGEEERAFARVGSTMLECLPYVRQLLRERLLDRISERMRLQLHLHVQAGHRSHRLQVDDRLIPGKECFLPWQSQMFFGHLWSAHLSGYAQLRLTDQEVVDARKTMLWFLANCWRQRPDGAWQSPYAQATDLSEAQWSDDPGIFGQGIAGLEVVADETKAKQILDWWHGYQHPYHPPDRWYPQRAALGDG